MEYYFIRSSLGTTFGPRDFCKYEMINVQYIVIIITVINVQYIVIIIIVINVKLFL